MSIEHEHSSLPLFLVLTPEQAHPYTCQLSRLRRESISRLRIEIFDLTPAHACGPISHA